MLSPKFVGFFDCAMIVRFKYEKVLDRKEGL